MELTNEQKLQKYRESDEDIVFGIKWFNKHQNKLLWFLNNAFTKRWFRYCLRIRQFDIPLKEKITEINTNHYSFGDKLIFIPGKKGLHRKRTTDFRTHDKFSKRLYFAFKPVWYVMHALDWVMLDRIQLATQYSFGFSSLTAYPGSIGTDNGVDGYVARSTFGTGGPIDETWATIIAGAGNDNNKTATSEVMIGYSTNATSNHYDILFRSIYCLDTSALTSGATISDAVFSLKGTAKQDEAGSTPDINIYTSTPASTTTLANADFSQCGSVAQCDTAITYSGWSTSAYNDFTFNSTGRGNISKTGMSKFSARNANHDVAASQPTWGSGKNDQMEGSYSNTTGTTSDPKLVITYTSVAAYTMVAAQGSFVLTGEDILLHWGHKMVAAMGSFVLTGYDIIVRLAVRMIASVGSFVLTGQNAIMHYGRSMVLGFGSFTLTGQDVLLHIGRKLLAEVGLFVLTGQNALINSTRTMITSAGSFVLTGQDVLLHIGRKMTAAYGAFTLTGQNILFSVGHTLVAAYGSFVLTGQSILFHLAWKLRATYGSFVLSGQSIRFAINGLYVRWANATKTATATFTTQVKNLTSWINQSKTP